MEIWERPVIQHVIGGNSVSSRGGETFTTYDPTSGGPLSQVALGREADVEAAVADSWRAFRESDWSTCRPAERANTLRRFAELIGDHADELARIDAKDGGGPFGDRRGDVAAALETLNFAASLGEHTRGATYTDERGYSITSRREPYGVVGAIAPWNFPFYFAAGKTASALGTGNAVVLKMAEQTPLSAVRYAELALEAGIPPGILNVVNGDAETGRLLAQHPRVPKVTFTGSTAVGQSILAAGATQIKSTHLELGGKSANIVFADADLDQALDGTLFTSFFNSGQICTSGARLLVHRSIYDNFVSRLVARTEKLIIGDPLRDDVHLGPLVSSAQLNRVRSMVDTALAEGATLLTGGSSRPPHTPASGSFFSPTLLSSVDPASTIAQEEIFGPVTIVFPFDTDEEAIRLANSVKYGLAATIWTNDLRKAHTVADKLDAGIIWANAAHHEGSHIPYEGHKLSGLGEDQGAEAIQTFTRLKVNHIAYEGQRLGWGAPTE